MRTVAKKMGCIALFLMACNFNMAAQKIYTKNGSISFFSKAPIENISASNGQVVAIVNEGTGDVQFSVLIKGFHFKKSLMEEHFNENYMESNKFPKALFKGKITDLPKINFTTDGNYSVTVAGDLTIHGVTKPVTTPVTFSVKAGAVSANAKFNVKLSDYDISIPAIVKDNIAKTVEVTVSCEFDQKM